MPVGLPAEQRTFRATTGLAYVTALATEGDDEVIDAWRRNGANVIVNPVERTSFPMKCNDGYRATSRPWLLFIGSDVVFRPGWWDHALSIARGNDQTLPRADSNSSTSSVWCL